MSIETKDIHEAIDRLARTPDGQMLYRYLQKTLCAVMTGDHHDGALRQFEGRRIFAAELMGLMAKGIDESDRHAITFSIAGPRAVARTRGAGRRVTLDAPVAGYDSDPDSGSDNSSAA